MQSVARSFAPQAVQLLMACAVNAYALWDGGNQWSGYPAWLSFFRHVVKLNLDYSKWQHYEAAAIHAGPRVMHAEFCIISDRPIRLVVDDQNRPHCADGPFCAWRDGTALWAWHGMRVPAWVITTPERITVANIQQEQNVEIRRVLLERYGAERYVRDSGAALVQHDQFGALYRATVPGDEDLVMVRVINSTPEQTGPAREYWLRVPPDTTTAHGAVAWSFGMSASEYQPAIET